MTKAPRTKPVAREPVREATREAPAESDTRPHMGSRRLDRIRAELKFDKHQLDEVLERQGRDFMDVADELAFAISRRDHAKNRVKELEIEVRNNLRAEAEAGGTKKPSEASLADDSFIDPSVRAARAQLEKEELAVARLQALRDAFGQRSYAIKDLVALELEAKHKPDSARLREGSRQNYQR